MNIETARTEAGRLNGRNRGTRTTDAVVVAMVNPRTKRVVSYQIEFHEPHQPPTERVAGGFRFIPIPATMAVAE